MSDIVQKEIDRIVLEYAPINKAETFRLDLELLVIKAEREELKRNYQDWSKSLKKEL